ncbi:MAG: GNAT family N-acetyltransferase [Jiangellaceae bacterium]
MIRTAEEGDVHALIRLGRTTWRSTIEPLTDPAYSTAGLDRWWTPTVVGRHVAAGNVLLAETPGRLLGRAEAHPARCVRLTVLRDNENARRFYRARGFRDCGTAARGDDPYPQRRIELRCDDTTRPAATAPGRPAPA